MSLQSVRERRHAVESVRDVVSAMRATAAGRIQAAQRAMAAAQLSGRRRSRIGRCRAGSHVDGHSVRKRGGPSGGDDVRAAAVRGI